VEEVEPILAALGFVRDRGGVFRERARRATARRNRWLFVAGLPTWPQPLSA